MKVGGLRPSGGGQTAKRSGGGKCWQARLLDLTRKPAEVWGGGGASGPGPEVCLMEYRFGLRPERSARLVDESLRVADF